MREEANLCAHSTSLWLDSKLATGILLPDYSWGSTFIFPLLQGWITKWGYMENMDVSLVEACVNMVC